MECKQKKENIESELKFATRDFLLVFSKKIKTFIIRPVIKKQIRNVLNNENFLKNVFKDLFKELLIKDHKNILIILNNSIKDEMIEFFSSSVFKTITNYKKINFSFTDTFEGFQIIKEDEKLIWDFTLESLTHEIGKLIEPHLIKYFI